MFISGTILFIAIAIMSVLLIRYGTRHGQDYDVFSIFAMEFVGETFNGKRR